MRRLLLPLLLLVAIPLQGAGSTATAVTSGTADVQGVAAASAMTALCGYTVTEKAGSTAEVILRAGTSTAGTALDDVTLAANGRVHIWLSCLDGPNVKAGVFVDRVSGNTALVIYTRRYSG